MSENEDSINLQEFAADLDKSLEQDEVPNWSSSSLSVEQEAKYEHLKGLQDHYANKKQWSRALLWFLGITLLLQWILIFFVGAGFLDFTEYQWLLPTLLIQTLMQVAGLAVIVIQSLFR